MFDISALKEMKLSELQEIAKAAKTIKITGVKKEALISHILELQSSTTDSTNDNINVEDKTEDDKPKRARILASKKVTIQKKSNNSLFADDEIKPDYMALFFEKQFLAFHHYRNERKNRKRN